MVEATETSSVNFSIFRIADEVTWSNTGLFRFETSEVITNGRFTSDDLVNLQRVGGNFFLGGIMDNTGRTFVFDDAKGVWILNPGPTLPGKIVGGTLVLNPPTATLLFGGQFSGEGGGVLDGVRIDGDLLLGPQLSDSVQVISDLHIDNGLQVTGNVVVRCGSLTLDGVQTLSDLQFQMKGQGPGRCSGGSVVGGESSDVTLADTVSIVVEGPGTYLVRDIVHSGTTTVKGTVTDTFHFRAVNRGSITVEPERTSSYREPTRVLSPSIGKGVVCDPIRLAEHRNGRCDRYGHDTRTVPSRRTPNVRSGNLPPRGRASEHPR